MPKNISVQGDTNVHGGAPFDKGLSTDVFINGKAVVLAGQTGSTQNDTQYNQNSKGHSQGVAANQTAVGGSGTVFINGKPVHRVGDTRKDGSTSGPGNSSVTID